MSVLSRLKTGVRVGDSVLDDILEDFSLYLRVEKRISGGVTRNYCYSVGKFLRWTDILNPKKKDTVKYYDSSLKEGKRLLLSEAFYLH